jgi:hypothetical protein
MDNAVALGCRANFCIRDIGNPFGATPEPGSARIEFKNAVIRSGFDGLLSPWSHE